jgi:fibronectin-binding autotransporter adhesin
LTVSSGISRGPLATGTHTINSIIIEAGSIDWDIAGSGMLHAAGVITETGGARGFSKDGSGTLEIGAEAGANGSNSWSGPTNINAGTLILNEGNGVNALPTNVALNGGNLVWLHSEQVPDSRSITMGSAAMWLNDGISETIASLSGTSNSVVHFLGNSTLTVGGTASTTFGGTFASTFPGGSNLNKNGTGTLVLGLGSTDTNANVNVTTEITDGALILNKADGTDALAGFIGITGGRLVLNRSNQINDSSPFSFSGGEFDLNGFSETVQFIGGDFTTINLGSGTLATNQSGFTNTSFSGVITGTGGNLVINGGNTLLLGGAADPSNPNTYTGTTYVNGGELDLGKGDGVNAVGGNVVVAGGVLALTASEQIPNTASLTVNSGHFNLNSHTETVGALTGSGGTISIGANGVLIVNQSATTMSYSGLITGSGSLTKSGTGTLKLSGSNDYSGKTVMAGGTLLLGKNSFMPILGAGAAVDMQSGWLVLNYSGGTDPVATIRSILTTGFNQTPKFNSTAIRTSNAADARKGIGYSDTTGLSQVAIAYTWYGDANLDGTVTTGDFTALASHFGNTGLAASGAPRWYEGDFNYDGKINALDFDLLATNFGQTLPAPALGSLLPEPSAALILLFTPLARRKRRCWSRSA